MSDELYFEVLADDLISEAQDATVVGFTPAKWLENNQRPPARRAKVDDHHNHTPIGEVVHTGISRDVGTSRIQMASAGCIIKKNNPLAIEMAGKVERGEIKSVSVEYDTHKDPLTGRKVATELTWIGLHSNPYNKRCVITRRQGDDGQTIEVASVPGQIRLAANPALQGTKNSIRLASFHCVQVPLMADTASQPGASAAPGNPGASSSPAGPGVGSTPPGAAPGSAPGTQVPPVNANPNPNPNPNQPPAQPTPPQQPSEAELAAIREHLENARKLTHDKLIVEAAQSARMKAEFEELAKFRAETLAKNQAEEQKQYEARKADFLSKKDQLKAVGWDLDKKEIADMFDGYLKNPTDTKNAFAVVALQQAKDHQERISKEAADAQAKAKEAQEREMLAGKWGQGVLEKLQKRTATDSAMQNNAAARAAPVDTAKPAQQEAPINPTAAMQNQLLGIGASQLNGLNRDPALQGLLGTTTGELLARAKMLANAHQDAILAESTTGSLPAKAYTHLYRQQRTDKPLVTQQGADGCAFTGSPIDGSVSQAASQVTIGDVANDLARTGRWKDMCAASVLTCDGKTFKHPVTGIEFPMDELIGSGSYDGQSQVFSPYVIAANILSAGEGYNIPWDNRARVQDYFQPKSRERR